VIGLAAALACSGPDPATVHERVVAWRPGEPIPDLPLVASDGREVGLAAWSEGWLLLTWAYTRCPHAEACPTTMTALRTLQERRPADLHVLVVTVDPAHDDPAVLASHAAAVGADPTFWTFATGEPAVLADLQSLFDVLVLPHGEVLRHTVRFELLAPGLSPAAEWTDSLPVDEVIARVGGGAPLRGEGGL
jgi:cytochrome oxidase Cu insertion factor (SCO1/SenC/PrrC family)